MGIRPGAGNPDEGPLETTAIRLPHNSNLCLAPQFVAEDLLRAEGFADIRYVSGSGGLTEPQMVGRGEIDFGSTAAAALSLFATALPAWHAKRSRPAAEPGPRHERTPAGGRA